MTVPIPVPIPVSPLPDPVTRTGLLATAGVLLATFSVAATLAFSTGDGSDAEPLTRSAERQSQYLATDSGGGTAEQFNHFR